MRKQLLVLAALLAMHAAQAQEAMTRRAREVVDLTAQLERCRLDAPGFADRSEAVHEAWKRRHARVLADHERTIELKVRVGRRSDTMLPLRLCTDDWLRGLESLTRAPDARFASVEKTWNVFVAALLNADRAAVLDCLSGRLALGWKDRALRLSNEELRRIGASLRAFKVQWGDDYEKEGLVADDAQRVFGIAFHSVNEEWKITEFGGAASASPAQ